MNESGRASRRAARCEALGASRLPEPIFDRADGIDADNSPAARAAASAAGRRFPDADLDVQPEVLDDEPRPARRR